MQYLKNLNIILFVVIKHITRQPFPRYNSSPIKLTLSLISEHRKRVDTVFTKIKLINKEKINDEDA